MTLEQLDLVTLSVTPDEARMLQTACSMRALALTLVPTELERFGSRHPDIPKAYNALREKIWAQSNLQRTPLL